MTLRNSLDRWYWKGVRDGAADRPPDPFVVSSHPGVTHRDNRHFRRAYDAGWHEGQRVKDVLEARGLVLQGEQS